MKQESVSHSEKNFDSSHPQGNCMIGLNYTKTLTVFNVLLKKKKLKKTMDKKLKKSEKKRKSQSAEIINKEMIKGTK